MKTVLRAIALAMAVMCIAGKVDFASAADAKTKVMVNFSGDDALGKQLDFFLLDNIRGSATFAESFIENESDFILYLSTLDPTTTDTGQTTVYSYVITVRGPSDEKAYIWSTVGVCGSNRVRECATSLFGYLGATLEKFHQDVIKAAPRK